MTPTPTSTPRLTKPRYAPLPADPGPLDSTDGFPPARPRSKAELDRLRADLARRSIPHPDDDDGRAA